MLFWLLTLSNVFSALGYLSQSLLILRALNIAGSASYIIWGWYNLTDATDIDADIGWNSAFIFINLVQMGIYFWKQKWQGIPAHNSAERV